MDATKILKKYYTNICNIIIIYYIINNIYNKSMQHFPQPGTYSGK